MCRCEGKREGCVCAGVRVRGRGCVRAGVRVGGNDSECESAELRSLHLYST